MKGKYARIRITWKGNLDQQQINHLIDNHDGRITHEGPDKHFLEFTMSKEKDDLAISQAKAEKEGAKWKLINYTDIGTPSKW